MFFRAGFGFDFGALFRLVGFVAFFPLFPLAALFRLGDVFFGFVFINCSCHDLNFFLAEITIVIVKYHKLILNFDISSCKAKIIHVHA